MANISLTNPHNVTSVLLSSSPKLGGDIDISVFSAIEDFSCENNNIASFKGNSVAATLKSLNVSDNLLVGSMESLSNNAALESFRCNNNSLNSSFPDITRNPLITYIDGSFNLFTGKLPNTFNAPALETLYLNDNLFDSLAKSQTVDVDLNIGAGSFAVGDKVYQLVDGVRIEGTIAKEETNANIQTLYLIDISDDGLGSLLFSSGANYSDLFSGIGSLGIENQFSVTESGGKFLIDGISQDTLNLERGKIYRFAYTGVNIPLLSTTIDGIHNAGVEYTDGISVDVANEIVTFIVPQDAPSALYYYDAVVADSGGGAFITDATDGEEVDVYFAVVGNETNVPIINESLVNFYCQNCGIDDDIDNFFFTSYTSPGALADFRCSNNLITGSINNLVDFPSLAYVDISTNQIANFNTSVSSILLTFNAQNNLLNQSATDKILLEFDNAGASNGTLTLDGTGNSAPTDGATNANYLSLISKGWTVNINT